MQNLGSHDRLRDNFEHLDEEALKKLQHTSAWLNDALLTPEDREDIAQALRAKPSKPIRFCASSSDGARPPESQIDAPLLFKQVADVRQSALARESNLHKHIIVMHQIVSRNDKQRLGQWHKRDELVRPLFDSVHFQLYAKRERYAGLCEGEMDSTALLQQRLVDSRFVPQSLYARDAVQMLEQEMGVRLVRLLLHQGLLLMLFEWIDVQSFAVVLCFGAALRCDETRQLAAAHILSLSADDLMKFNEPEQQQQQEKTTSSSSTTTATTATTKELPLELSAETHPMSAVKRALQSTFIAYVTLAYVRRDG